VTTTSEERLQKTIARSGFTSRRKAEELIAAGRVSVDGVVATIGQKIEPETARVEIDGIPLPVRPGLVYYLLNKPRGVVSSVSDPGGRPVVVDLVPGDVRVWPIGRLDVDTEGLIILTNDGDLTNLLTHPRYEVPKRYVLLIEGVPTSTWADKLVDGVELDDGRAAARSAKIIAHERNQALLEVVMTEGRKREIRRMCETLGHAVITLFRTAIGPVGDPNLPSGESRPLSIGEVRSLYRAAGADSGTDGSRG
jgi:pseudouridine synthase